MRFRHFYTLSGTPTLRYRLAGLIPTYSIQACSMAFVLPMLYIVAVQRGA
jgi:hypothetical protein